MTEWRNWSGSVTARPQQFLRPRTPADLAGIVQSASSLRVVGAGHSFMPLCATDGTLVSLDAYEGDIVVAADHQTVWAPAGWSLERLTAALWARGLSLINQGDINRQSLAGALATGTHGTGAELGSISTQACGFRLMLADGAIVECGPDTHPALYQAQRLSLGLLGVATEIRLRVMPAYHLEERITRVPLSDIGAHLDELAQATRHMEFFVLPYAEDAILKTLHPVAQSASAPGGSDLDDTIFKLLCDIGAAATPLIPSLQRLMMRLSGKARRRCGPAYQIFAADRAIKFEEMEYELPRENGWAALRDAIAYIRKKRLPITFPFEFRLVAGDDIWLSPFNAGPGASISMHQYAKMPWREAFSAIEPIFREAGGRPHWAKRHTLQTAGALYPKLAAFLAVRETVDPDCIFANAPLRTLFGLQPGKGN
jgi:FAD-linked oxidoreductase